LTPERWHQVSRIFKSAISLDGEARADYVAEQCGTDDSLRSEVEKLIASHRQASDENFIAGQAADVGAVLLAAEIEERQPRLTKGQQLGSYVILDRLGAGGMGEVYLAKDSRLERTVALKVLSPDISADKRRMQRFRQEAKVASSLNQPNILTIFEFGDIDGLTFLATEFIDGKTLRDYLHRQRLKTLETLEITVQILAALEAAHEAHIVHRDMKPENLMFRPRDPVVMVLYFGRAKVTEKRPRALTEQEMDSEAATEFKTTPGVLMGTINYMSPEQARAATVDERTDIWSVGVMLYEMVTGAMPFSGPTSSHTLVQIIDKEPAPLPKSTEAPAELQRIIRKAMAKSADERYQSAKDMRIDLNNLRKQLDQSVVVSTDDTEAEPRPDKKRVVMIALAAMLLATVAIFAFSVWRARKSAAVVAPVTPAATPAAEPENVLTYSITVQKFRNGKPYQDPFVLPGEIIFEADYRIRLTVLSPQPGHLYVLNEGPGTSSTPEFVILFPSSTANSGSALLRAETRVQIPQEEWFQFDAEQGTEKLWLVFSQNAIPELENLRRFVNPKFKGLINDPAENKVVQSFLEARSTARPKVEKSDIVTTLRSSGELLLYAVKLEHH
jgi:serine/threonine protein kinase